MDFEFQLALFGASDGGFLQPTLGSGVCSWNAGGLSRDRYSPNWASMKLSLICFIRVLARERITLNIHTKYHQPVNGHQEVGPQNVRLGADVGMRRSWSCLVHHNHSGQVHLS